MFRSVALNSNKTYWNLSWTQFTLVSHKHALTGFSLSCRYSLSNWLQIIKVLFKTTNMVLVSPSAPSNIHCTRSGSVPINDWRFYSWFGISLKLSPNHVESWTSFISTTPERGPNLIQFLMVTFTFWDKRRRIPLIISLILVWSNLPLLHHSKLIYFFNLFIYLIWTWKRCKNLPE